MATRREFDWVGEKLSNPDFTNTDFKNAGVNIENTSIGPESVYVNNPQIRALPEFQTNGKFDEVKFHEKYVELAKSYNDLARNTYYEDLKNQGRIFAENNIFVSPEERRQSASAYMTLVDNPDHITYGISGIDKAGPRTKTPMELAEMHPIYDSKTGKFTEYNLEDSLFKDFWRPKMMATYDTNVDINGNPTDDPTKIVHYKGEYKLKDGEYYSEFVDGRSTYGKEIISDWNILTQENSWINKYDPFDSDDIEKSTAGSIARNALKILPLLPFSPLTTIAPYYAAASIGINLVDALGTLGKLVMGSENKTLNKITAFAEQFNQTTSEEGLKHSFGMENVINMIGDTFMFLKSQRILAEQAPKLFMRDTAKIIEDPNKSIQTLTGKYIERQTKAIQSKYDKLAGTIQDKALLEQQIAEEIATVNSVAVTRAQAIVNNQVANFQKLGRQISTSMMAITFGLHTYGTAKAQNVSDEVATALTLGAIAGQYALLGSHIGQKIFPEATIQKQQIRKALETWLSDDIEGGYKSAIEQINKAASNEAKQQATKGLLQKGWDIAKSVWNVQESPMGTTAASTVATAVEMTSFTALDDVIASIYNLGAWLSGNPNRMTAWDLGRYGSSLLGGAIAGAIGAPEIYRNAQRIKAMDQPRAFELIAHMINEGKEGELLREIDKHEWAPKDLSTEVIAKQRLPNGEYENLYGTGTETNNLNDEIKNVMKETILDLKYILNTYGTIISKNSLLDVLVNGKNITKDLRFAALKNSNYAQAFLEQYIQNQVEIYKEAKELSLAPSDRQKAAQEGETGKNDEATRQTKEEEKQLQKLADSPAEYEEALETSSIATQKREENKKDLRELLKINRSYTNGTKHAEFIQKALFEMQYGINSPFIDMSFRDYIKGLYPDVPFEKVSTAELKKHAREFYGTTNRQEKIAYMDTAFDYFQKSNKAGSDSIKIIKQIIENEGLSDFLKIFDIQSIATKNQLFGVIDPDKGVVNPFDQEEQSQYKLNKATRPEDIINRKNFNGYAEMRETYNNLYILMKLLDRYAAKGDKVTKEIRDLFMLFDDINLYRRFLFDYRAKVNASIKQYEEWKTKKAEFETKPENAGKTFEPFKDEFGNDVPLSFRKSDILREINKTILEGTTEEQVKELNKEAEKEFPNSKQKVSDGKRLLKFISNIEIAYRTEGDSAYGDVRYAQLFNELTRPLVVLTEETNFERALVRLIDASVVNYIGDALYKDLSSLLSSNTGYINDYAKEQLITFISRLKTIAERNDNLDIKIPYSAGPMNLIPLLSKIEGMSDFAGLKELKRVVARPLGTSRKRYTENMAQNLGSLETQIKNYNSNGLLAAADKLMKELTGTDTKTVSGLMQAINAQVAENTGAFTTYTKDIITNVEDFLLSPEILNDIDTAVLVLQMLRSSYAAATEEVSSVFNHIGFNATVNKIAKELKKNLTGGEPLVTISAEQVANGIRDIQDSIYKLLYWKEVARNAIKKRTEITDTADLGFRLNLMSQISNKINLLVDFPNWNGISEFNSAVEQLEEFNTLKKKEPQKRLQGVSQEQQEKILQEEISFTLALRKFYEANKNNVDDIKILSQFINKNNFKIEGDIIPIDTTDRLADDSALMWYIATVFAFDPEIYYSNAKNALLKGRLPVALQTMWKYQECAFFANKEIFNKFKQAYIESFKDDPEFKDLNSTDPVKREKAEQKFADKVLSFVTTPMFDNIFLVSSGPGFGKSSYIPELINTITKIFEGFRRDDDLWICGPEDTTAEQSNKDRMAKKLKKAIGSKNAKTFTRDSLMRVVVKEFNKYETEFKVTDGQLRGVDENGIDKKYKLDVNTGRPVLDYTINDTVADLPKILVIDEISEFSDVDLFLLDDFAKKHNITVFAHGDFAQSGIYGELSLDKFGVDGSWSLGMADTQFIRSFKSQLTFRSTNTQTDLNNSLIRTFFSRYMNYINNPSDSTKPSKTTLKLHYYFDKDKGDLYGTFVEQASDTQLSDTCIEYINGIYKACKEQEKKVSVIYTSEDSLIYKYIIEHPEWAKYTELRRGTTLKSQENDFYIIDLQTEVTNVLTQENKGEIERLIKEYYTALTRQKQGSIIVDRITGQLPEFELENMEMSSNTQKIALPDKFVEDRQLRFAEILSTMFPTVKKFKAASGEEPPKPEVEEPPTPPPTPPTPPPGTKIIDPRPIDVGQDGDQDDVGTFESISGHESRTIESKYPITVETHGSTPFELTLMSGEKITGPNELIKAVFNTFNAQRTGLTVDNQMEEFPARRDCAYGLQYLEQKLRASGKSLGINFPTAGETLDQNSVKRIKYIISRIQTLVKSRDNNQLKQELFMLLNLRDILKYEDFDIRYFVATYYDGNNPEDLGNDTGNPFLNRDPIREKAWGGKGQGNRNNEINRKELLLFIGRRGNGPAKNQGDEIYLTIPIATFPNYRTIFVKSKTGETEGAFAKEVYEALNPIFANKDAYENPHAQDMAVERALVKLIKDANNAGTEVPKGAMALLKMLEFYLVTSKTLSYLNDKVVLAKTPTSRGGLLTDLGWFVTASDRGFDYDVTGFELTAKDLTGERLALHDVEDLELDGDKEISDIVTLVNEQGTKYLSNDNGTIMQSGAQYVMITNVGEFQSDMDKLTYLERQLHDPTLPTKVKLQAIRPPVATFEEFITSERDYMMASKDSSEEVRQDIGNQFTIYRILQKIVERYKNDTKNGGTSPLQQALESIGITKFNAKFNINTIANEILRFTWIEGEISPERKAALGNLWTLADEELSGTIKDQLRTQIQTQEFDKSGYITAITALLKTKPLNAAGHEGIMFKTKHRKFLMTLYNPDWFPGSQLRSYDKTLVQEIIKEEAEKLALLYNPSFDETPMFSMNIIFKGVSNTIHFHKVNVDVENRFSYKNKNFKYASNIYSGPLAGNLMAILDSVLKGIDPPTAEKTMSGKEDYIIDGKNVFGRKQNSPAPPNFKIKWADATIKSKIEDFADPTKHPSATITSLKSWFSGTGYMIIETPEGIIAAKQPDGPVESLVYGKKSDFEELKNINTLTDDDVIIKLNRPGGIKEFHKLDLTSDTTSTIKINFEGEGQDRTETVDLTLPVYANLREALNEATGYQLDFNKAITIEEILQYMNSDEILAHVDMLEIDGNQREADYIKQILCKYL